MPWIITVSVLHGVRDVLFPRSSFLTRNRFLSLVKWLHDTHSRSRSVTGAHVQTTRAQRIGKVTRRLALQRTCLLQVSALTSILTSSQLFGRQFMTRPCERNNSSTASQPDDPLGGHDLGKEASSQHLLGIRIRLCGATFQSRQPWLMPKRSFPIEERRKPRHTLSNGRQEAVKTTETKQRHEKRGGTDGQMTRPREREVRVRDGCCGKPDGLSKFKPASSSQVRSTTASRVHGYCVQAQSFWRSI